MTKKQKLGRAWIGKDNRPKLEPRILLEDAGTWASWKVSTPGVE